MKFFRCWSVRNLLDLYADNRLTESAQRKVSIHLDSCAECRERSEELGAVPAFLKETGKNPVPPGLESAILKSFEEGRQPAEAPALGELLKLGPARATALLCLALWAGSQALPGPSSQGHAHPDSAVWEVRK